VRDDKVSCVAAAEAAALVSLIAEPGHHLSTNDNVVLEVADKLKLRYMYGGKQSLLIQRLFFRVFFIMVRQQLYLRVRIKFVSPYSRFSSASSAVERRVELCVP
jgi:hypothetical protein